jgi:2-aminoethylphosphonate-pyruvate transaminase
MRYILLNPGPVSISDGVRKSAVRTDLCHREPEYFALQDRVRSELCEVYGLDPGIWTSVLLGGSGTTALEAMLSSLLPRDARLLVIENGVYGERISRIADIHGVDFRAVKHEWAEAIDFQRVEEALADESFTHLAAVHHETTTGRLNDVERLAELCERHGASLLLDAVSSFGAESIPFESPALIACAATANLPLWAEKQDRQGTPFTPPVNSLLALDQALAELKEQGGWRARHANYSRLAGQVERSLAGHGVELLLEPGQSSCVLHAYHLPDGKSYEKIHAGLKQRGFVIYAGQGNLAEHMFRISTMGEIGNYDMERLLAALSAVFSG